MMAIIRFNDPTPIPILLGESLRIDVMDKKQFPFSTLTEAEWDAIRARAMDERARILASVFGWVARHLARLFSTPAAAPKASAAPLATRAPH
jgi:hypothetical protein